MSKRNDNIAVIAHRGASGLTGEDNTLRSFDLAIEMKCDYVEFDVRRTRDEIVCYHDSCVGQTPVAELTLVELRECAGLAVPSLNEVLQFCRGRIGLDVEIKDPLIEADVVASLRAVQDDTRLLVKSFDAAVVANLVSMAPPYPAGLLVRGSSDPTANKTLKAAIATCRAMRADFLSPHFDMLTDETTAPSELQQMPIYPWTVNDETIMAHLARLPIHGIITDRPDLLLKLLRQTS